MYVCNNINLLATETHKFVCPPHPRLSFDADQLKRLVRDMLGDGKNN